MQQSTKDPEFTKGLTVERTGQCVSTPATVLQRSTSSSSVVDGEYFLVKRGSRGLTVDASYCVPTKDSKELSSKEKDPTSAVAVVDRAVVARPAATSFQTETSSGAVYSAPSGLVKLPLLRAGLSNPMRMLNRSTAKHAKFGNLDVYRASLTYVNGATSDASGNLPGFFPVSNITATGGWSSFAVLFDLVRLRKVTYWFEPKLGHKTVRSYTPLTATACQTLRVKADPDGALGSPTVSQALSWVPNSNRKLGGMVKDYSLVDPFHFEYVPTVELLRANSASGLDLRNLHDWVDVGDLNSYASTILCGGITYNVLQAGACPASTDIFSITMVYEVEFAIRNN